jgi:hypothetical protein
MQLDKVKYYVDLAAEGGRDYRSWAGRCLTPPNERCRRVIFSRLRS